MRRTVVAASTLLLLACGDASAPLDTRIGVEGGTITGGDGRVTLVVPAQALSGGQQVSIRALSAQELASANGALAGTAFALEPAGLALQRAANVTVRVDAAVAQGAAFDELTLVVGTAGAAAEVVSTTAPASRAVSAAVDRLGFIWVRPLQVTSLAMAPMGTSLVAGAIMQLAATPRSSTGRALQRTVSWTSRSPAIAVVGGIASLRTLTSGTTWVVAECEGVRDSVRVSVSPAVTRIDISPGAGSLLAGDTVQMQGIARDADGIAIPSAIMEWLTSDSTIATISPTGALVTKSSGSVMISVRSGGASNSVSFAVTDAVSIQGITALDGQPTQMNAVSGTVLVLLRVAQAALPVQSVGITVTCTRGTPFVVVGTADPSGVTRIRVPTDSVAVAGNAVLLNGQCGIVGRAVSSNGAVRRSSNVALTLTNVSSFAATYDVSGAPALFGTTFPASVPAAGGRVWRTGGVTLHLQGRNFDATTPVTVARGTFLGRSFDVTTASADSRFDVTFPNVANDPNGRGIADVVSPAGGSVPVVATAQFGDGSAAFTRVDGAPLHIDNQPPSAAQFSLSPAGAALGWLAGAYAFTSGYVSAGDGGGVGGGEVVIAAAATSAVQALGNGTATGSACVQTGLQRVTTGVQALRLLPRSTTVTNRSLVARAFEADMLGNVRCTDLASGAFGVDTVPPTLRLAATSTPNRSIFQIAPATNMNVEASDLESGMVDPHTVRRRAVGWSASRTSCIVGSLANCDAVDAPDVLPVYGGRAFHWRDSSVAVDRVGNVSAPLITEFIDGNNQPPLPMWTGFPAVFAGGSTFPLTLSGDDALGLYRAVLYVDYSYSRAHMIFEIVADTLMRSRWDLAFYSHAEPRLTVSNFMRKLQVVDQADAPYDDAGEYSEAYGFTGGFENIAGILNTQFLGIANQNTPQGYTYFGKGIQQFRITTRPLSISNDVGQTFAIPLTAELTVSTQSQLPLPNSLCFYFKMPAAWLRATCINGPAVTTTSTGRTITYNAVWDPPAALGTSGTIEMRAVMLNATGDGLSTNTSRTVTLTP